MSGHVGSFPDRNREPEYPVDFEGDYCYGIPEDIPQDEKTTETDYTFVNEGYPRFTNEVVSLDHTAISQSKPPNYDEWPDIKTEGPNYPVAVNDILAVKVNPLALNGCLHDFLDPDHVRYISPRLVIGRYDGSWLWRLLLIRCCLSIASSRCVYQ